MAERIDLSVVIPAYNEQGRLPATLAEISQHLAATSSSYEIIVVDDGSTDATGEVTASQAQSDPHVQLLMTRHAGKGAAVRSGALAARGTRVLFCDADLPMAPAELTRLAAMLADHDIVIASREGSGASRLGEPYYRHLMGRVFNLIVQVLAIPGVQDTQCGLKCFTAESAAKIFRLQTVEGFGFDVEILYIARKLGYHLLEVPIIWSHRESSRVDPVRDTLRMLGDILRVRWNDLRGVYGRTE
ncbi:MAG: dolichyl-phosphate beta-glucosyltransferase [Chloroflexota bacterium]